MSISVMSWAWRQQIPSGEKLVLLALSDRADDSGHCFPGLETLSEKTSMSRRGVQKVLAKLEERKLIARGRRYIDGRRSSNQYSLHIGSGLHEQNSREHCSHNPSLGERCTNLRELSSPDTSVSIRSDHTSQKKLTQEDRASAKRIFELIRRLNPSHKDPNIEKWADDVRLMRERDRRTHEEIESLFRWANQDEFWQSNVLSPQKLRKHWDRLVIQRDRGNRRTKPHSTDRPIGDALA